MSMPRASIFPIFLVSTLAAAQSSAAEIPSAASEVAPSQVPPSEATPTAPARDEASSDPGAADGKALSSASPAGTLVSPPETTPATPDTSFDWNELDRNLRGTHQSAFDLFWRGYGELNLSLYNYGLYQTSDTGSPADRRATLDTRRFVLELELEKAPGIEIEAEIEFEHGGTGSTLELDYNEEFGEFEQEVEKGGEVVLEKLMLQREVNAHVIVRAGRLYVAQGLLSGQALETPADYLAAARPESETTVVPGVWDELGLELQLQNDQLHLRTQVVSGLDSTAFNTENWIGRGQQTRYEQVVANRPAVVGRLDYIGARGITTGISAYAGDVAANRPKPDMEGVKAPLVLLDAHLALRRGPARVHALGMWGHLAQAALISDVNARLPNNLGVDRTAVGDEAILGWLEAGYNIAPQLGRPGDRIEPFVKLEYYDTLFRVREDLYDNPRFERRLVATGFSWQFSEVLVGKLELSERRFGSSALRPERTLSSTLGFVF